MYESFICSTPSSFSVRIFKLTPGSVEYPTHLILEVPGFKTVEDASSWSAQKLQKLQPTNVLTLDDLSINSSI
jgi:hypothetical protein